MNPLEIIQDFTIQNQQKIFDICKKFEMDLKLYHGQIVCLTEKEGIIASGFSKQEIEKEIDKIISSSDIERDMFMIFVEKDLRRAVC